jgi:hypothetical protein
LGEIEGKELLLVSHAETFVEAADFEECRAPQDRGAGDEAENRPPGEGESAFERAAGHCRAGRIFLQVCPDENLGGDDRQPRIAIEESDGMWK